ncbi:hypothetical protein FRC12_012761 [Ceratobasidium sp. 428]|nr:hypothetical protein FRC12_012761 [Ceratobasidium sp. 428]
MPILWETVNGVHKLLTLLPNVSIRHIYEPGYTLRLHIDLPDPNNTSFERFDYYASLVKHLDVFGDGTRYLNAYGWHLLSQRARTQTLLPNLLSITVREDIRQPFSEEQLHQVSGLISPSLVSYWYKQNYDRMLSHCVPGTAVTVLLDTLLERCSTITRLAIYPKTGSQVCRDLPAAFASQAFSHLRVLSGGVALAASDLLAVIGTLPQLEHFIIRGCDQRLPPLPEELPIASFPALKRLFFSTYRPRDAFKLAHLEPLLCQLKFLELELEPYPVDEDPDAGYERLLALICDVIPFWLEKTACLQTLFVDIDPYGDRPRATNIAQYPLKIFDKITELQIQRLHLHNLMLDPRIFPNHFDWLHLKELYLPDQYVPHLGNLYYFAALPCLEYLQVQLRLSDHVALPDEIWGNRQLRTIESSRASQYTCVFQDVNLVAGALLKIWPNLLEVRCDESIISQTDVPETACTVLNKRIAYMGKEILTNGQSK